MCHVLIIEDEPLLAMLLQDLLEDDGATSFTLASTEAGAIEAARAQRAGLITSDVRLTQGTGPGAVEAIHRLLGPIPVIFITGTPAECAPCGANQRILSKPVDARELGTAFRALAPV